MIQKPIFKSRKFWATVAGIVLNGLAVQFPEYKPVIDNVNLLLLTYIGGVALADAAAAHAAGRPVAGNVNTMNVDATKDPDA